MSKFVMNFVHVNKRNSKSASIRTPASQIRNFPNSAQTITLQGIHMITLVILSEMYSKHLCTQLYYDQIFQFAK